MKKQTYKILRIICCVTAALILAGAVFVFIYCGWAWGLLSLLAAAGFTALTFFFKREQEKTEEKEHPSPARGDFITGPAHTDDDSQD